MANAVMRIGLKLYSTDTSLLPAANVLHAEGLFSFIEMYLVPGTWESVSEVWRQCGVPCIVHAPHSTHGVNLADAALYHSNKLAFNEVRTSTDVLQSSIIVVHSGNNGTLEEVIRQLRGIGDSRIHIENKPRKGIKGERCIGSQPKEVIQIIKESGAGGFVFDFGHAVCAGITEEIPLRKCLAEFAKLKPVLYHLSDGILSAETDSHLNLGKGEFDLPMLTSFLRENSQVTLETNRRPGTGLADFESDCNYFRRICP